MAMEDYLQMGKTKKKENATEDMKGGNDLSFLDNTSLRYSLDEENVRGQNETSTNDENMIGRNENASKVNIQQKVEDMFADTARKNKCFVPLERLQEDVLQAFKPSMRPPSIDPYSGLEDVGDTDDEASTSEAVSEKDNNPLEPTAGYYMRECKSKRNQHSDKPLRESRMVINYADLIGS